MLKPNVCFNFSEHLILNFASVLMRMCKPKVYFSFDANASAQIMLQF